VDERFCSVDDVVALGLGGRATMYSMIKSGQIPSYRIGVTGVRVRLSEVMEALKRPVRTEASR
jgi:excisionase family DNA binding protein